MNRVVERIVTSDRLSSLPGWAAGNERLPARDAAVEDAIRRRIKLDGASAHYFREVTFRCSGGIVLVSGRVPTDRLKQALWSLLRSLDGITEVDDQLDVVSSTGLSNTRPK
jgi:osmotically-inducible protein OsmY